LVAFQRAVAFLVGRARGAQRPGLHGRRLAVVLIVELGPVADRRDAVCPVERDVFLRVRPGRGCRTYKANCTGSQQHCCGDGPKWSHRLLLDALNPTMSEAVTAPVAAFSPDENNTGRFDLVRVRPRRRGAYAAGSTFEINHEPLTFVSVIRTALGVINGCGLSLPVVVSLRNASTTAESGPSSDTAARTTAAVCTRCFCCTVGMTISLVNLS